MMNEFGFTNNHIYISGEVHKFGDCDGGGERDKGRGEKKSN